MVVGGLVFDLVFNIRLFFKERSWSAKLFKINIDHFLKVVDFLIGEAF